MFGFTYVTSFCQKTIYAYQVGIYKEEKNKDKKISELKESGYNGYCYKKEDQYYVLSMISENYDEIKQHSTKVKGIIKQYEVSSDTSVEQLLKNLEKEKSND